MANANAQCSNGFRFTMDDYIKANRIGSRQAEMENQSGWSAKHKVHKNAKAYNRKDKHRQKYF
jgi:hypothetical protein